jgi:hypothetical protein
MLKIVSTFELGLTTIAWATVGVSVGTGVVEQLLPDKNRAERRAGEKLLALDRRRTAAEKCTR